VETEDKEWIMATVWMYSIGSGVAVLLSLAIPGTGAADPECDHGGPYAPCLSNCPFPTQFDGSGSYAPGGTIISYEWEFGDGGTATGATPEHVYAAFGDFTVTLTVTDDRNASSTCSTVASVHCVVDAYPWCEIEPTYAQIETDEEIRLDGSNSRGACSKLILYEWDFDDGGTATGVSVTHRYQKPGLFAVHLAVYDEDYWTSTCEAFIR
jgi:chitodextrinase